MTTSRAAVVWRYLPKGRVKHALRTNHLSISLCGTAPVWFAPSDARWQDNATELPECRRCAKLLAPDDLMAALAASLAERAPTQLAEGDTG